MSNVDKDFLERQLQAMQAEYHKVTSQRLSLEEAGLRLEGAIHLLRGLIEKLEPPADVIPFPSPSS